MGLVKTRPKGERVRGVSAEGARERGMASMELSSLAKSKKRGGEAVVLVTSSSFILPMSTW